MSGPVPISLTAPTYSFDIKSVLIRKSAQLFWICKPLAGSIRERRSGSHCATRSLRQAGVLLAGDWLETIGVKRHLRVRVVGMVQTQVTSQG